MSAYVKFANDNYPDIDDTAEVALALRRTTEPDHGAEDRAIAWVIGMQCADGGWAAFDVDNTQTLCAELPFCDFGELIDPPSADVTAHVVEMAGLHRPGVGGDPSGGAVAARPSGGRRGSWFGRWGANYLYGTGTVVPALVEAGLAPGHPAIRRAVGWLGERQNRDGGWGEDLRSYDDPAWKGRGESTASQTAWALLALLAAGERGDASRPGGSHGSWPTSGPTAAGTSRGSPGPGSPATSTSTTTSTGSSFRSWRWAGIWVPGSRGWRTVPTMGELTALSPRRVEAVAFGGPVITIGTGPDRAAAAGAALARKLGPDDPVAMVGTVSPA